MNKEYKKIANVAALAGQIMLESHAESYRVEQTVRYILNTSGLSNTEVISTTTGLFLTLDDVSEDVETITLVRRITNRGNHLSKIYKVNNISRQIVNEEITIDEAYEKLLRVDEGEYPPIKKDIAIAVMVMGFTILLGGNWTEVIISAFAGIVLVLTRRIDRYMKINGFIHSMLSTFVTSFFILSVVYLSPYTNASHQIITIAAFMPLYPGTAFTNGVRDTLKGDYVSGVARIADAVVVAVSLGLGVALGLFIFNEVVTWGL